MPCSARYRSVLPITILLSLSLLAQPSFGTTIVVVVARDGIVLASDSKATSILRTDNTLTPTKSQVMTSRSAVGVVGLGDLSIKSGSEVLFHYDSTQFLEEVKNSLPVDGSVDAVASVLKEKSHTPRDNLEPYVESGFFNRDNAPGGDVVDYIVVGYENRMPLVFKISIEPDWGHRQLSDPILNVKYPDPNHPSSDVRFYGVTQAIENAADANSQEHRTAATKYSGVIAGIESVKNGATISWQDGVHIATDLIRLQSEFDPKEVGLPINVIVLFPDKNPIVSRFAK